MVKTTKLRSNQWPTPNNFRHLKVPFLEHREARWLCFFLSDRAKYTMRNTKAQELWWSWCRCGKNSVSPLLSDRWAETQNFPLALFQFQQLCASQSFLLLSVTAEWFLLINYHRVGLFFSSFFWLSFSSSFLQRLFLLGNCIFTDLLVPRFTRYHPIQEASLCIRIFGGKCLRFEWWTMSFCLFSIYYRCVS